VAGGQGPRRTATRAASAARSPRLPDGTAKQSRAPTFLHSTPPNTVRRLAVSPVSTPARDGSWSGGPCPSGFRANKIKDPHLSVTQATRVHRRAREASRRRGPHPGVPCSRAPHCQRQISSPHWTVRKLPSDAVCTRCASIALAAQPASDAWPPNSKPPARGYFGWGFNHAAAQSQHFF
jgi:hypothetical protein